MPLGLVFLAMLPSVSLAPSREAIDLERVLQCIEAVEGNPWTRTGGAYGYTYDAWIEDAPLWPYKWAMAPDYAKAAAMRRLLRFSQYLDKHGYVVTPQRLGQAWRHSLEGALGNRRFARDNDYGERVSNLYFDKEFKP